MTGFLIGTGQPVLIDSRSNRAEQRLTIGPYDRSQRLAGFFRLGQMIVLPLN